MAEMTDSEILKSYRNAENKAMQVQILAELNCCPRKKITGILIKGGEKPVIPLPGMPEKSRMPESDYQKAMIKSLDSLNKKIYTLESWYEEIAAALKSRG